MTCHNCGGSIHESPDPNVPFVHDASGNGFCDVRTTQEAVDHSFLNELGIRNEAVPSCG